MTAILVVGGQSTIGSALVSRLRTLSIDVRTTTRRAETVTPMRSFLDLSNMSDAWEPPKNISYAFLCAGEASIQKCYDFPFETRRVNVEGITRVASKLLEQDIPVVFLSTNLVYDGSEPFQGPDQPYSPKTEYGRQTAEVESRIRQIAGPAAIVRMTKVLYDSYPLFKTWADTLNRGESITPFGDLTMAPLVLQDVLDVLIECMERCFQGILQLSSTTQCTYADVAHKLARRLAVKQQLVQPTSIFDSEIKPEWCPVFSTLDIRTLQEAFGQELMSAEAASDWALSHL